jgi:protein O-GlcNAc transferase
MSETINILPLEEAIQLAVSAYDSAKYRECLSITNDILAGHPENVNAKYILALCYIQLEEYATAERILLECLVPFPRSVDLLFNLGVLYNAIKNTSLATQYYEKVLELDPNNINALNNLANIYNDIGNNDKALQLFNHILNLGHNLAFVHNNISLIYKKAGMLNEAVAYIMKALELEQNDARLFHNAAITFLALANYKQGLVFLEKAVQLDPDNLQANLDYFDCLMRVCDWEKIDKIGQKINEIKTLNKATYTESPMGDIQRNIDPAGNLAIARNYTNNIVRHALSIYPKFEFGSGRKNKTGKIRIGYMSSDIKDHPVAHLMRGVFKNHNKNEFEVYLYSSSGEDLSGYKDEIKTYCDKFVDVANVSNYQISQLIYNDEIDILIDLNGHTGHSKLDTLCLKPAPVQVNYLGYIGSMGADFIDYIITDKIVTPPDQQQFYMEKFAYLPDCYQANDNNLKISDEVITRQMEGLPEDAFVFCSFNQTAKIEPVMFDVWMNILKRIPNSVLWLYKGSIYLDDHLAANNLRKEAQKRGVDPTRLILTEGMYIDKHLKRKGLANLALDTRIYNGGTVTSQTLWAGVPVLTLQGGHFASRMASSILNAVGMNELITTSLEDYENMAVELAGNPEKLAGLKKKLAENLHIYPLFKIEKFVGNLEKAYKLMWGNYAEGNNPKQIEVD